MKGGTFLKTRKIVKISMLAAFISVLSLISVPMPSGMPITLQTFAIAFSGYFLGARDGALSVLVYISLGAVGLPIFSGARGGFSVIFGATGGFLFGFVIFAFMCGVGRKNTVSAMIFGYLGLIVCHFLGILQFGAVTKRSMAEAFLAGSLPYIPKDAISVVLAYCFYRLLKRRRLISALSLD